MSNVLEKTFMPYDTNKIYKCKADVDAPEVDIFIPFAKSVGTDAERLIMLLKNWPEQQE